MSKFAVLLFSLALLSVIASSHAGRLYKWVDSQGKVSYHDRPPPEDSGYSVERKDFKIHASGNAGGSEAMREAAKNNPVILYSVPKCASCDLARSYLEKHKFPFKEKDVETNRDNSEELKKVSGTHSVPTITVGAKVITGFTQDWLESELKSAGYPYTTKEQKDQ